MHYILLTILGLLLAWWMLHNFINANPKTLAMNMRKVGGMSLLALAIFFALTGRVAAAAPLAFFALAILGKNIMQGGFNPFPGNAQKTAGQGSRVRTDMIEMELDHDTGAMDGTILRGAFHGRRLSSLSQLEGVQLFNECSQNDSQSAQLMEAYLDRTFPEWRDGASEAGQSGSSGSHRQKAPMTLDEALEILGLDASATRDDIRKAHRNLMKKLHPDQGGSTYLASKINEAKDLLLDRR